MGYKWAIGIYALLRVELGGVSISDGLNFKVDMWQSQHQKNQLCLQLSLDIAFEGVVVRFLIANHHWFISSSTLIVVSY